MSERIRLSVENGIADVRLNRPEKMNALDGAMFDGIEACGKQLSGMDDLRAVVISGEGRAFCGGLDMAQFDSMASGGETLAKDVLVRSHGLSNQAQHIVMLWRDLPVPVIAAVHGVAFGGGFQLMLGADIRIVAPDTKLSIKEIHWGLVPDMGGIALMRLFARDDVIREFAYTGRQFSGQEAVLLGFATRAAETPYDEAKKLAAEIAQRNPDAVRAIKRLLNLATHASLAEILLAESAEQQSTVGSPNQIEAVNANLQRRVPVFG